MSENWNLEIVADTKPEAPPEKPPEVAAPVLPSVLSSDHSLGKIMAMAREARGFSREQAAKASNIPGYYLTMIESDDYSSIADQLYLLPFLRRYATFVGLEPEEVASRFIREVQRADMNPSRTSEPIAMIADRRSSPWRLVMMILGSMIVAGVVGWFAYQHFMPRKLPPETSAAPTPAEQVVPEAVSPQGASSPDAFPQGAAQDTAPAMIGAPAPAAASSSGAISPTAPGKAAGTTSGTTSNVAPGANSMSPSSAATRAASSAAAPAEKSLAHPATNAKPFKSSRRKLKAKANQT